MAKMASSERFILRVETSNGTKRIECDGDNSTAEFMVKVQSAFGFDSVFDFAIFKDRSKQSAVVSLERKTLRDCGLKHGDLLFLITKQGEKNLVTDGQIVSKDSKPITTRKPMIIDPELVPTKRSPAKEDDVDVSLWKASGLIERPKNQTSCNHGANMKCVYCAPIAPYDEGYLKEMKIKHMSFHAYLRKLTDGVDRGKFAPLENISCRIKPGCKGHPPWPNGICTKCQPNAVTLNRQAYRHVDNVVFENASIVERFLNYWRTTGHQRIGMLYGYYQEHKDVPLGIKATVGAIYEPPQESTRDVIKLQLPERDFDAVERIARQLGLCRVGWIFTDLVPEDVKTGTVKYHRRPETYFLSAQECLMAGYFQTVYPNACRLSSDGYFGSKFVTICVTGDKNNQVHMEGYQVSNQCMALVRDNCFLPTKDSPELGYVRESSNELYVPDVFFKEKDKFGNEIQKLARPLPVEYLLVDVPVSALGQPKFTFNPLQNKNPFPIENRFIEGQIQDFHALTTYFNQFTQNTASSSTKNQPSHDQFLEAMSDFHLLFYLSKMETLPFNEALDPLLDAVRTKNRNLAIEWSKGEKWATVEQLFLAQNSVSTPTSEASSSMSSDASSAAAGRRGTNWSCKYCTFENLESSANCEMCGLPK